MNVYKPVNFVLLGVGHGTIYFYIVSVFTKSQSRPTPEPSQSCPDPAPVYTTY